VWASVSGAVLTITTRSTGTNWLYTLTTETNSAAGTISVSGDLESGAAEGTWTIDPSASSALNRAFRDWHADFFSALHAAGIGVTASFSQELVNPPDNPGGGAVWVQRFPNGAPVETATGFGSLNSSQAAFGSPVQSHMTQVYIAMAALMSAAAITPRLQFGEVLWWFEANASGMAFYDADTQAAALTTLGRALVTFHTPNDDPSVNSHADANFLRARLKSYVDAIRTSVLASYSSAVFELLWPMDANDPDTARLLRYVNLPVEWQTRAGSGFDTFMCEAFRYGGVNHNLDQAKRSAAYPFTELSWDRAHCRYLMGLYLSGWPWQREYLTARRTGLSLLKMWAYDHVCLFGWPVPLPKPANRPIVL